VSRKPNSQAQQTAHDFIRQRILDGEYPGGTWLKPQVIADALSLSRMPVREALRGLEMEGLVTIRPNRGAIVTELAIGDVDDLFEIRANLEVLTARSAVPALNADTIREIERLRREMDAARSDSKIWIRAHNAFHDFISNMSGRKRLLLEIERARALVQPYIRMYIDIYGTPELPAYEHSDLVAALLTKDPEAIDRAFRSHVKETRDRVLSFLKQHYAYRASLSQRKKRLVAA
jgi:DNA-binding GntR family transcriptional regulator